MRIYIKESDIPKTKTRTDLVRKFLRGVKYNSYFDELCTKLQCEGGRYRSISELHEIVKSRFPNTSLNAMIRIIYQLIEKDKHVVLVYCTTVRKVVVKYEPNSASNWISDYSRKKYLTIVGDDGYSLKDYEDIKNNL